MAPASAKMGYSIMVNADGTTWEISRSIQQMNFIQEGSLSGEGRFSRFTNIEGLMGIKVDERSSSARNGSLEMDENLNLQSREGPVVVTTNLISKNFTDVDNREVVTGSAEINVDEAWAAYFSSYKKVSYLGPAIRTSERYENEGDAIASFIDSRKLVKQSLYGTYTNRTLIYAMITPGSAQESINSNRSSRYTMDMKTIGTLTHIDATKRSSSGGLASRISEDYRGQVQMSLRIGMDDSIKPISSGESWLPCCEDEYIDLSRDGHKYNVTDSTFNYRSPVSKPPTSSASRAPAMILAAVASPTSAAATSSPGEATAIASTEPKPASRSFSAVAGPTPGRSSSNFIGIVPVPQILLRLKFAYLL